MPLKDLDFYQQRIYQLMLLYHFDFKTEMDKAEDKRDFKALATKYNVKIRELLVKIEGISCGL